MSSDEAEKAKERQAFIEELVNKMSQQSEQKLLEYKLAQIPQSVLHVARQQYPPDLPPARLDVLGCTGVSGIELNECECPCRESRVLHCWRESRVGESPEVT